MYDIAKNNTAQAMSPGRLIIQAGYESLTPATRRAYETDLRDFFRIVGKDIIDVSALDIPAYIEALEKTGLKNSTINRKLYSLSKVCKLYQFAGLIDKNPVAELRKVKKITRAVSKQINAQIDLADIRNIAEKGTRTAVVIETLANTGLRISELVNIRHADIEDYETDGKAYKRIRIVGKNKKERHIYLSGELYQKIKQTFSGESEYLFHSQNGNKLHRTNLFKQIKQTFATHTGKDIHPHSLRHFYATYKIDIEKRSVKAVSKYLGHSSTAITLDMYVDTALTANNSMITT